MTVNAAGLAGGSTLTEAMKAKATYGSWIAASYALVKSFHFFAISTVS